MMRDSVDPSTSSPTKDVNDTTYKEESEKSRKNLEVSDGDHEDEDQEDEGEEDNDVSRVSWFYNQKGNEFFCQLDDGYLLDDSNLSGLSNLMSSQNDQVEWAAEMLYGLIHARYILTSQRMSAMLEKYRSYDFGTGPRFHCSKQRCLPVGESDTPRSKTVITYCPKCEDIYAPESKNREMNFSCNLIRDVDGACFGATFPRLFFMTYQHLRPEKANESYVPRIHGFKISK